MYIINLLNLDSKYPPIFSKMSIVVWSVDPWILWICDRICGVIQTFMNVSLRLELVSEELNHLAAILHVYAGGLIFMK